MIHHHLPAVNIAMMAKSANFRETVTGADNLTDGTSINGVSATAGMLTETMELMLNDFRLSLLGSSPGYQATFQASTRVASIRRKSSTSAGGSTNTVAA